MSQYSSQKSPVQKSFAIFPRLTLASSSPRRRDILNQLKIPYELCEPNIDERTSIAIPRERVCYLAEQKARAVQGRARTDIIIASDTIVALPAHNAHTPETLISPSSATPHIPPKHYHILEKPSSLEDARNMLNKLSNCTHEVHTSICLAHKEGAVWRLETKSDIAQVCMREISDTLMTAYLTSSEWQGVAGGYRIQGLGALLVNSIQGSYSTVMGLSIPLLYDMMRPYIIF